MMKMFADTLVILNMSEDEATTLFSQSPEG